MSGKQLILLILVGALIITAMDSFYIVDEREKSLLFQFGEVKRSDETPGLHFKLPFVQNVRKFDDRILTLDSDSQEFLTLEKKPVKVDFFVQWRIADVKQYYRATGGGQESEARQRLTSLINRGLRDQFGNRTIKQAISGERAEIMSSLEADAGEQFKQFGVELIDVRVKQIDLTDDVAESVYNRMRSERQRVAAEFRARGEEEAEKIRADADREREVLLASAYRQAEELRGVGDAQAAEIYAQAYEQDREFYNFYRSLDVYIRGLANGDDVLVLEPNSPLFRYFGSSDVAPVGQ